MQPKDEWVNKNVQRKRLSNIATGGIHKRCNKKNVLFDKMHKI